MRCRSINDKNVESFFYRHTLNKSGFGKSEGFSYRSSMYENLKIVFLFPPNIF